MAELLAADALDATPATPAKATQADIKIRDFKFVISVRLLWFPPIEGTKVRTLVFGAPITSFAPRAIRPRVPSGSRGTARECETATRVERIDVGQTNDERREYYVIRGSRQHNRVIVNENSQFYSRNTIIIQRNYFGIGVYADKFNIII